MSNEWKPYNLLGQPVPVFDHPYIKKKRLFCFVRTEFSASQFVPIGFCPVIEHHQEVSGSVLFNSFPSGIYTHEKDPPEPSFL